MIMPQLFILKCEKPGTLMVFGATMWDGFNVLLYLKPVYKDGQRILLHLRRLHHANL